MPLHPVISSYYTPLSSSLVSNYRRSTRPKHTPTWMNDFVSLSMNKNVPYPMCNSMSYDHLSTTYQSYIASSSVVKEYDSYYEVVKDIRCLDAMEAEI